MLSLGEVTLMLSGCHMSGHPDLRFSGVSTDSRTILPGELFVALRGENFDAHRFVGEALRRGAVAALVEQPVNESIATLTVPSARRALGELARGWRSRFDIPLILVVGSNGKTTTKEMIASILAAAFGVAGRLATSGNLNNDVGLPLTLLRLRTAHRAAVVELGMNHPGETRWLATVAQPTIAVVTNAQREHQEFMQNVLAVAREHALAIEALPDPSGVAVFPAGDSNSPIWAHAAGGRRVLDFALTEASVPLPAAIKAVGYAEPFNTVVHLDTPEGAVTAKLATAGTHNILNAAAAAGAAMAAGVDAQAIRVGLEAFAPLAGRMRRIRGATGALIIDDTYNANPDSVRAAIDAIATGPGSRLLVLGDMGEVGTDGPAFHTEVGAYARHRGIESLYATGALMRHAVEAFGAGARHFEDRALLIEATRSWLLEHGAHATLLVKGSRFMTMEQVVTAMPLAHDVPSQTSPGAV